MNVPFAIVRKPAVFAPWTVIVPPGRKSRVEALLVPLFRMTPFVDLRSSVPKLVNVALAAPVKVMPAPAVSAFVLKSIVPALTGCRRRERTCAVCAPVAADWKMPPASTVTLPPTVSVRAVVSSYWRIPPLITVRSRAVAAVSIVTVQPLPIVTLSAAGGDDSAGPRAGRAPEPTGRDTGDARARERTEPLPHGGREDGRGRWGDRPASVQAERGVEPLVALLRPGGARAHGALAACG